ncbi:hypothetical protein GCM10009678_86090 [Actinomadura kijaniata]|uniref:Uncharacterized protein n=1 Tax=Actinomadura namibiensis TaxID=182080 RepID=A0A7W3QJK2_ACTNM|nr:hypothetical protein [Actinomadura namibiensis]MBA8949407.1 hypothetical protein [Actinomadura namibiensis]
MPNNDELLLQLATALVDEGMIAKVRDAPPAPFRRPGRCVWVQNPRHPDWTGHITLRDPEDPPSGVLWWFFSWNERISPAFDLYGAAHRITDRLTPRPTSLALTDAVRLIEGRLVSRDGLPTGCAWGIQSTC